MFFEAAGALLHDFAVLGALALWPVHGAFMAFLGLFQVAFEGISNLFV